MTFNERCTRCLLVKFVTLTLLYAFSCRVDIEHNSLEFEEVFEWLIAVPELMKHTTF